MPNFHYVQGSVDQIEMNDFDYIFHAASAASPTKYQNPEEIMQANLLGAEKLIAASPNLKQFVYISSGEVYGANPPMHVPEGFIGEIAPDLSRSSYPKSKLLTEELVNRMSEDLGFRSTIIRLFHTFGPGLARDDGRSFSDFVWAVAEGKAPVLHTPGDDLRAFLYMEDSIAGIVISASQEASTKVNVGSSLPTSIRELANVACEVSGFSLEPLIKIEKNDFEYSPVAVAVPSNNQLLSFGWEQKYTIHESLKRTIDWARSVNQ
jgi:nucleoside-diphosphate-sugar epimerase